MRNVLWCMVLGVVGLSGCASVPQARPVPISADAYDVVYAAANDVLRDKGFVLDRQDYRFGVVTTEPRLTGTLLEPWLGLGQSPKDAADATLDRHRRVVRVNLLPAGAASGSAVGRYLLDVQVHRERLALPTRRVLLTGALTRTFDTLDAVPTEWARRGVEAHYWEPIDRDPRLEAKLREAILKRAQVLVGA